MNRPGTPITEQDFSIRFVVIAVITTAVLRYLNYIKGPLLILITSIVMWIYFIQRRASFSPYRTTIYFNFEELRHDLGLSKSDKLPSSHSKMYDVYEYIAINAALFAHYRRYTGTSAAEFSLANRFERSREEFLAVLAFRDELPCTLEAIPFDNEENRDPHPTFFCYPDKDGLTFGVNVLPKWWYEHCKQCSPRLKDLPVSKEGKLLVAALPYGYIRDHLFRSREGYWSDRKQRKWKARLAKGGWTAGRCETILDHRYLSISCEKI